MPFPPMNPALDRALAAQGYAEPTPVQAAVLEADADGRDLLVSAQTGSGKTVAFGLAMPPDPAGRGASGSGRPARRWPWSSPRPASWPCRSQRELAWLYAEAGARVVACVGGMDPRREQRALAAGATSSSARPAACATTWSAARSTSPACSVVVLDEADEMLDLGFREDLEFILDAAPAERRTLLFSATIAKEIAALARRYQSDALRIDTDGEERAARRHRVPGHPRAPRTRSSTRSSTCCATSRRPARWCSAPPARRCATCTAACASAASRSWPCRAS